MPDTLQFVDAIAQNPTVRLDLNNDVTWALQYEGTSFDPPPRKLAIASTLLTDGAVIPAGAYDNRRLRLRLDLITTTIDGQAVELQKLHRELERRNNILRWQPAGATQPVFLRTLWSAEQQVTDYPGGGKFRTVEVALQAEPFAYGLRENGPAVTVNNDPAAGSNGCFFDVTDVKGDVETPLFLSCGTGVQATGRRESAIGVRRRGTPTSMPLFLQAEAMTVGTDTTVQSNDALMSGAGPNYTRTTFGNINHLTRLTITTFPATASVDVRGTYRVYARIRRSVSGDTVTMQLSADSDGTIVDNDIVTLPSGTDIRYIDLGLMQFPLGYDPQTDGYSGSELSVRGQTLYVRAGRTSGSGNLDIDVLLFVPADDRFAVVRWSGFSGPTAWVIDSARVQVYGVGASGEVHPNQLSPVLGLPPYVTPGVTNRICFVRDVGSTATGGDVKTGTVNISTYYWPRYLHVRPPTT